MENSLIFYLHDFEKKPWTQKYNMGKIIVKGATQMNGHFFKLYFYMFEKS